MSSAGRHQLWAEIVGAQLKVLDALGRHDEARRDGVRWLKEAYDARLDFSVSYIELPLAVVFAALGQRAEAEALCATVQQRFEALGTKGLNVGLLYEARARVAQRLGDVMAFESFAARCGELYRATTNRSLIAKHGRLVRDGRVPQSTEAGAASPATLLTAQSALTHLSAALSACPGPRERARLGLDLLVARSGAVGGFLFAIEASGPVLVAQVGLEEPPSGLTLAVGEHLRADVDDYATVVSDGAATLSGASGPISARLSAFAALAGEGRKLHPVLISHRSRHRFEVTGMAVMVAASDRPYADPTDVAAHVSRAWFDSGDVTSVTAWLSAFTSTD